MANVSWLLSTVLAYGAGAALSFVQELLLKPRPTWRKRPFAAWSLHLGVWSAAFGCGLLLVQRPVCAAFALLAAQLVILLVSNAKFAALREPFIFQDFEYFVDAMRHPRLYLPFLGLYRFL